MNLRREMFRYAMQDQIGRGGLPFLRRHGGNHYDHSCGHHVDLEIVLHLSARVLAVVPSRGPGARLNSEAHYGSLRGVLKLSRRGRDPSCRNENSSEVLGIGVDLQKV